MKEQWTQDLQKKMSNYEVPTIPEGLWEDIDAAIGEIPSKTTKKAALFPNWKKACAAILLLLLIPTTLLFLNNNKENEALVENGSVGYIPQPTAPITPNAPTSSPIAQVNHIATPLAQKAPNTPKTSLVLAQSPAPQEEATTPTHVEKTEKEKATSTSAPQSDERATTPKVLQSEDAPIFKQEKQDGIYLAMNASGINLSSGDWTSSGENVFPNDKVTYNDSGSGLSNSFPPATYHEEKHDRPITIGLQVGIPVADRWSVATGLAYTYLHSEIEDGTALSNIHTDQKLHFIGVPVQLNYQLYNNRYCDIYIGTGGRIDFGVSGKTNHDSHLSYLPVNFSLKVSTGVQVKLFKSLNIYAEPSVQYNIPGSTRYKTYFTEHKTMFDLQLGVRFTP
ncbi:MAG: outer membrane beta-barrel protein [Prevotella sp.]|nr:outer membrane beta-barrel protein [Prevotella sp.]